LIGVFVVLHSTNSDVVGTNCKITNKILDEFFLMPPLGVTSTFLVVSHGSRTVIENHNIGNFIACYASTTTVGISVGGAVFAYIVVIFLLTSRAVFSDDHYAVVASASLRVILLVSIWAVTAAKVVSGVLLNYWATSC
jgi:hypothetical protein